MRPRTVELKAPDYARRSSPALPGGARADRNSCRSSAIAVAPQCSYTGRRGRVGVLKPEAGEADTDIRQHPGGAVVIRIPSCASNRFTRRRGGAEMWVELPTPPEASAVRDANTVVLLPDADAVGNTINPPTLDQARKPACRSARHGT